jgi:hypothetical protein
MVVCLCRVFAIISFFNTTPSSTEGFLKKWFPSGEKEVFPARKSLLTLWTWPVNQVSRDATQSKIFMSKMNNFLRKPFFVHTMTFYASTIDKYLFTRWLKAQGRSQKLSCLLFDPLTVSKSMWRKQPICTVQNSPKVEPYLHFTSGIFLIVERLTEKVTKGIIFQISLDISFSLLAQYGHTCPSSRVTMAQIQVGKSFETKRKRVQFFKIWTCTSITSTLSAKLTFRT